MTEDAYLRRHDKRYDLWSLINSRVPESGRVLLLDKIPHPYHIRRSFVSGSYLEQGLIDYHAIGSPDELLREVLRLGVTHVAQPGPRLEPHRGGKGGPGQGQVTDREARLLDSAVEHFAVVQAKLVNSGLKEAASSGPRLDQREVDFGCQNSQRQGRETSAAPHVNGRFQGGLN